MLNIEGNSLSEKWLRRIGVFSGVCLAGLFVGAAGGVEWGTPSCGGVAFVTLIVAALLSSDPVRIGG